MALDHEASLLTGRITWRYEASNTGFEPRIHKQDDLSFELRPGATLNHLFGRKYVIRAGIVDIVDFYALAPPDSLAGVSATITKITGFLLKCEGNGGVLKIEPDATNPLNWPFVSGGSRTFTPGTGLSFWLHQDGTSATVSATSRRWKLSNTGAATITAYLTAFTGT